MSIETKTDDDFVREIRDAVNKLQTACKAAITHGLIIDMEIEADEDDDTIPVIHALVYREWQA